MNDSPSPTSLPKVVGILINNSRWAALATQGTSGPDASWVAYATEPALTGFLLHLSQLAPHTRNLLRDSRACLTISEQDNSGRDPQTLARVMIAGQVTVIEKNAPDYPSACQYYQKRLPDSPPRFSFTDFLLLRLKPVEIRFVGGFAQAYTFRPPWITDFDP